MKFKNPFKDLTKFELMLWLSSVIVVTVSFLIPEKKDFLTLVASLIGVTALIFLAKGYVIGQVLVIIFAIFYSVISFIFNYYGELITYACMTAPMAVVAMIAWIKNPYKDTKEVKVSRVSKASVLALSALTVAVTVIFYFVLAALNTANIVFSTISIATSFFAVGLTYLRSPLYAIAYALNDIVLIVLWSLASVESISYVPMVICFVMFLINDIYGFVSWQKMKKRQKSST